ncbi:Haloacid dehalogenase-like hydrolase domain-containing protein, partial [Cucurbita argyrosperma subsp. argyrosperma]
MASISTMLVRPNLILSSSDLVSPSFHRSFPPTAIRFRTSRKSTTHKPFSLSVSASLQALIFDCDGVILESEHLHRQAYNDAFAHFDVRCPNSASQPLNWSIEFYDELQNRIGGGKPKMRWYCSLLINFTVILSNMVMRVFKAVFASVRYFKEFGWPSSTILEKAPEDDEERAKLIDVLQAYTFNFLTCIDIVIDWKTERYKEIIKSGTVKPRPGVLSLMDEAKSAGRKLAVCSAATKSSVILCLENLIGIDRFQNLDCFLAGDDVKEKKPDPSIYIVASKKLGVSEKDCLVVEDSVIGLQAATKAGMQCVITYTASTADQDFKEAIATYPDLSDIRLKDLDSLLQNVATAR